MFTTRFPRLISLVPMALGLVTVALLVSGPVQTAPKPKKATPPARKVSYHQEVREIFRKRCQGCHQPANKNGNLVLTSFALVMKGGKQGPLIVRGKPDQSLLIKYVIGPEPKMPISGDPLTKQQIEALRLWILQGAQDDSPRQAVRAYTRENPPKYVASPVLTALAISPDGQTLAVSGFHEILLRSADASKLIGRLVGNAVRIDALAWSPKGKYLAAVGGTPGVNGQLQLWDAAERKLVLDKTLTLDTIFSTAFSPDGKRLAVGCVDNSVRVLSIPDGKELFRMDHHGRWVMGVAFTRNGLLMSCSPDRAVKVSEAKDGTFLDDANKLYQPVYSISYHPRQSWFVAGGEDRIPRVYKFGRLRRRIAIDYDFNLLQAYERQPGPINDVTFSPDGKTFAVASAGDEVRVYAVQEDYPGSPAVTDKGVREVADLGMARKFLDKAETLMTQRTVTLKGHQGATFTVAYSPDGGRILTGGFDGLIRVFDAKTGKQLGEHAAAPIEATAKQVSGKAK